MPYEQFQSFISKHMKFHLFQQELKSKIYATVVLVMYNMNLVQRERERNVMYLISKC